MKKIFFTLMALLVAVQLNAQDQTDPPGISVNPLGEGLTGVIVEVFHDNPEVQLYYRFAMIESEDYLWSDWSEYTGALCFTAIGEYRVEAYAVAPGLTPSYICIAEFYVQEPDPHDDMYYRQIADFGVDGIYYRYTSDSTVMVSMNDTYDYPYTEPFGWELYSVGPYSGDVIIPPTVEYKGNIFTVEGIDNHAFINCALTSITLPNTIKYILSKAFVHATIESGSIFIPASVTTIEPGAFADCYDLNSVRVEENNPVYDSRDNCNAIIETATNALAVAFNASTMPSTVTAIGDNAFAGDAYSGWAYYSGCSLTDYVIPNSIKTIGNKAFYLCTGLNSVDFDNELTSIGDYAFAICNNLKNVTIPDKTITIGNGAFAHCYNLNSAIIGNSVTSIGDEAFYMCDGLVNLSIGNSVKSIGKEAFWRCDQLTSIIFPNSVESIGDLAFNECSGLTSITFGDALTSIGRSAFSDCSGLKSIKIPNSVTSIGQHAFYRCTGLQRIICMSIPPLDIDSECFNCYGINIYEQATLFVPAEAVAVYRAHGEWGKFLRIVPFIGAGPGDINGDGNIAINDVTGLIDMLLSDEEQPAWLDVNGDGAVNVKDITELIDILLNGDN